jgi:hypothetical protein
MARNRARHERRQDELTLDVKIQAAPLIYLHGNNIHGVVAAAPCYNDFFVSS